MHKKNRSKTERFFCVGVKRLELLTTCTPCKYASQLRYTPIIGGCIKTTVQR